MKNILSIVTGFIHDFAAGCWAATVFAVYWIDKQGRVANLELLLLDLKKQFFFIGIFFVLLVFVTGAGRSFTYVGNFYGKDSEQLRRRMLILKHLILFVVFGVGIYWQYSMIYR